MDRRRFLGTLGAGTGVLLAGCSRNRVDGEVVSNETPLSFSHEYATQGTSTGTRVLVEVTAENDGDEPITTEEQVPDITCTFLDDDGEKLYEAGRKVVQPVDVGESTDLEFPLTIDTEDVTRYELRSVWVDA